MIILGLCGLFHKPSSAAIIVEGQLVAAAEESVFGADDLNPSNESLADIPTKAIQYCLDQANVSAHEINVVALPYESVSFKSNAAQHYLKRHWYAPDHVADIIFSRNRSLKTYIGRINEHLKKLGCDGAILRYLTIDEATASAFAAAQLCGVESPAVILSINDSKDFVATCSASFDGLHTELVEQTAAPDSLGAFYNIASRYLGINWRRDPDALYLMANSGNPLQFNVSQLIELTAQSYKLNTEYCNVKGIRRYHDLTSTFRFSQAFVDWLGPNIKPDRNVLKPNPLALPYPHYAAAFQALFETTAEHALGNLLNKDPAESGNVILAGNCGYNLGLIQRLTEQEDVHQIFASNLNYPAGASVNAAIYAANQQGIRVQVKNNINFALEIAGEEIDRASETNDLNIKPIKNIAQKAAQLIASSEAIAWMPELPTIGLRNPGNFTILFSEQALFPGKKQTPPRAELATSLANYGRYQPHYLHTTAEYAQQLAKNSLEGGSFIAPVRLKKKWQPIYKRILFRDEYCFFHLEREQGKTANTPKNATLEDILGELEKLDHPPVVVGLDIKSEAAPQERNIVKALQTCKALGIRFGVLGGRFIEFN